MTVLDWLCDLFSGVLLRARLYVHV